MARPKRDLKVFNINVPTPLAKAVEEYASDIGLNKTDTIIKLLNMALESKDKAREKETV